MKYIQIDEDEDEEAVEELVKKSKRASDANLAWEGRPMTQEEKEDSLAHKAEDFI